MSLPAGFRHVDHVAFTVPNIDEAVAFFVNVLGAQELYRSKRGPDAEFMPEHFEVPADARMELAMLRMPPNLNVELFQWWSEDQRQEFPRHCDIGGSHLCFVVDDIEAAIAYLESHGAEVLGTVKEVRMDSPVVAGNRWVYIRAPFGLMLELVDRSRVQNPPPLVGPADWSDFTRPEKDV